MNALPEEIRTRRLVLRQPRARDVPDIVRQIGRWEVARWLGGVPQPYVPMHARRWLARQQQARTDGRDLDFGIALASKPDRLVGGIGCRNIDSAEPVIGYWLKAALSGRGYVSEALAAMLEALVMVRPDIRPIATTMRDNVGSIRVLTKAGFRRERRPVTRYSPAYRRKFQVAYYTWQGPAGVGTRASGKQ